MLASMGSQGVKLVVDQSMELQEQEQLTEMSDAIPQEAGHVSLHWSIVNSCPLLQDL